MSTPANLSNTDIYRGDSFTKRMLFGVKDSNGIVQPGTNLLAYGSVWTAQLRASENAEVETDFTVNLAEAGNGYITLSLSSDQTTNLPAKGVWDLQVVNTGVTPHIVRTFVRGSFSLTKDVTRP